MRGNSFDRYMALLLLILGVLCLLQAAVKPMLWFSGSRASGYIHSVETEVSRAGAVWTHYSFQTANKERSTGSAMAAGNSTIALHQMIRVAYFEQFPYINMPAYGGYAAVIAIGWLLGSLFFLGIAIALWKNPRSTKHRRL